MKRFLISLLALGSLAALNAQIFSYQVTVDTSSIGSSTPGYIEFQFNQANASTSQAATASLDDFISSPDVTFDNTTDFSLGGVAGSLFSLPLEFDNTVGGTNLYDQGVSVFGTSFQFTVTLEGAALSTPATDGSEFFVYVLDSGYNNLLGPVDSGAADLIINGDTSITPVTVTSISTITPVAVTPEPSTLSMLGIGGAAIVAICRRRRNLRTSV